MTGAQRQYGDGHVQTTVFDHDHRQDWHHDDCFGARDYYRDQWGADWCDHPHGFYAGDSFFLGFELGQFNNDPWYQDPVYVVDPCTGDDWGTIAPPDGDSGFSSKEQAELAVLGVMANPPNGNDPTAGLYRTDENGQFDPLNPGDKVSPEDALGLLESNDGQDPDNLTSAPALYFHPASLDGTPRPYEKLQQSDDLAIYLASKENKPGT